MTKTGSRISGHLAEVMAYCGDVKSGAIPSGAYAKKAVRRFVADMRRQKDEDFLYAMRPDMADDAINFAERLRIPDLDGRRLELLPWHKFVYYNLFGWVHKLDNSRRRFRSGYVEVARKNSKTTSLLFPMILYDFKRTPAAESFFVSKDLQQSAKSYAELRNIFMESFNVNRNEVTVTENYGIKTRDNRFVQFFSSDTRSTDGYKNSLSVIDEFHSYESDRIVTAFKYGGRARVNNLVLIITSAGTNVAGPCYAENEKARKVLNGLLTDDTYFALVYAYDDGDDWKDPANLAKANPSLGTILRPEILRNDLDDALITPSHQADFKAKTCGIWQNETSNWIPLQKWDTEARNGKADLVEFEGRRCFAALDLSSVNDFTAYTRCFERDGRFYLFHRFYVPSGQVAEKYRVENINIRDWIDRGIVTATPGPTVDYDFIIEDIKRDGERFDIVELAYDKWQSNRLIDDLEGLLPKTLLVQYDQSLRQMSNPSKEFERLVLEDKIVDGNPVMKWMVSNAVVKVDPNGNYKPLKDGKSSTRKIDGVITSIMAIDRHGANARDAAAPLTEQDVESLMALYCGGK